MPRPRFSGGARWRLPRKLPVQFAVHKVCRPEATPVTACVSSATWRPMVQGSSETAVHSQPFRDAPPQRLQLSTELHSRLTV